MRLRRIFIFILFYAYQGAIAQSTLYVPSEFSTIQSAIDNSENGDTILVSKGTYIANISIENKEIILKSISGADSTIIEPLNSEVSTLLFLDGGKSIISGFTFTNGVGIRGSAINFYLTHSDPIIENCIISGNVGEAAGNLPWSHRGSQDAGLRQDRPAC